MPETGEIVRRPGARPGRCSNHPGEPAVGACSVCERALCLACAIPVRGSVVGPECLRDVVEDPPEQVAPAQPPRPRGDVLAAVGFLLVVIASVFPWARGIVASGFGEAWAPRWSLVSVAAGAAGLIAVAVVRRTHATPAVAAVAYATCASLVALGAIMHSVNPPPLSNVSGTWPWRLAVLGSALAFAGVARRLAGARGWSTRRRGSAR